MRESEAMSRPHLVRRRFLINRPFQFAFIGRMVAVAAVIIGVFHGANEYFFWNLRREAEAQHVPLDHIFFRYLDYHEQRLAAMTALMSIVVGPFAAAAALRQEME